MLLSPRPKKITLARLACLCFDEGCPIHPIRNGSPKWCRSVTDRDGSSLCVSFGNVGGSSWWCRFVTVCQFAMDLKKYFWRCYGVWWKCGRIVPIGTDRDDPPQPWRMVSIRDRLSVCKSLTKYSKWCYGVCWKCRRIVPIGTDRDDPSQPSRMVTFRDCLSVRDRLRKYLWRCYGAGWKSRRMVTFRDHLSVRERGAILISATPYWNSNRDYQSNLTSLWLFFDNNIRCFVNLKWSLLRCWN